MAVIDTKNGMASAIVKSFMNEINDKMILMKS